MPGLISVLTNSINGKAPELFPGLLSMEKSVKFLFVKRDTENFIDFTHLGKRKTL